MNGGEGSDRERARRKRNIAIALILGGVVILFFLMTIVKLTVRFGS